MKNENLVAWALLLLAGLGASWAGAQHGEHAAPVGAPPEELGEVFFPVSCNAAAQEEMNRAMALLHSFWFEPAQRAFGRVVELDPECGMGHWGIALSSMGNPFTWPPNPTAMGAAAAAVAEARRVGAKSEREGDYIAALAAYFEAWETTDHRARALALERALGGLAAKHSDDDEARIFHALSLVVTAVPTDKSFANQRRAAAILEPLFAQYPDHPGAAHYLIHAYDYAELAGQGLEAARAYARIAPSVPHALHMPSHIFSRTGLWPEMVESNRASYRAARSELRQATLDVGTYDALHAMDYLVFGHLQMAQDRAAKRVVEEVAAIREVTVENFVAAYAFAAIPARYALERGDWLRAAALELSPPDLAWGKFPQAEAILVFARGLGAARAGQAEAARKDVERLRELLEAMAAAKLDYWAAQADFQIQAVEAWIALAQERPDEALRSMRAAADAEEASDKHPVTPGNVAPSRELLGEMLLELDRPAEALAAFERSLERDPNRFRTLSGAARAAEAVGSGAAAREYYGRLAELASHGDTQRSELARAVAFLSR